MNTPASPDSSVPGPLPVRREEFEVFLHVLTHEIRNRLNSIALEAADLAEQAGPPADATRLQQHVQDCSAFLKKVCETLAPDAPHIEKVALADFVQKLRERMAHDEK
jgi:signal transduction histidine kinase